LNISGIQLNQNNKKNRSNGIKKERLSIEQFQSSSNPNQPLNLSFSKCEKVSAKENTRRSKENIHAVINEVNDEEQQNIIENNLGNSFCDEIVDESSRTTKSDTPSYSKSLEFKK
jgi:hypothetical protein